MGRMVIVAYKPKAGRESDLENLVRRHVGALREQGLATDRPAQLMRAADGTIVEVFEWESPAAIEKEHSNPVVLKLWEEFGAVCEFVPIGAVAEAQKLFSEFEPI